MIERLFGHGRRGGVLIIAGAVLGALVVGPGATIAQKAMNLTTSTGDKRYVKRSEVPAGGQTVETPLTKFTATTFTSIASTRIKAPGPGFLVINASLSAKADGENTDDKLQYRLAVGTTPISTAPQSFELFLEDTAATSPRQNGSVNGFVKVARKGPLDVKLEAQNVAPSTGADILGRSIVAQFVPKAKVAGAKKKKKPAGGNVGP